MSRGNRREVDRERAKKRDERGRKDGTKTT